MLEVQNLSYSTKTFSMENVSFSLDDGYLMTLLGRNGAGKTTLFDLVYGRIEPLSGSIIISTHLVEEVNDITDYIGLLDNGRLVKFGDREQILNDDLGNKNKNLRELLEEENG